MKPTLDQMLKRLNNAVHIKSQKRLKESTPLQAEPNDNNEDNEEGEDDG